MKKKKKKGGIKYTLNTGGELVQVAELNFKAWLKEVMGNYNNACTQNLKKKASS